MVLSQVFFVVKHSPQVFNLAGQFVTAFLSRTAARAGQQGTQDTKQGVGEMLNCIYSRQQSIPYCSSLSAGTDPQQEWLPRHISSCGLTADLKTQLLSKGKLLLCRIHNHLWDFSQPFSKGKQTIQQAVHQHEGEKGMNQ